MKHGQRGGTERSPGSDPGITALLRATYAAPAGDQYWSSLEERIMARIKDSAPVAWWAVFPEWRNAGLLAATLAFLVAGGTMLREKQAADSSRQLAISAAYYTVFDEVTGDVTVAFTIPRTDTPRNEAAPYIDPLYP